jgi:uncharacterized protein
VHYRRGIAGGQSPANACYDPPQIAHFKPIWRVTEAVTNTDHNLFFEVLELSPLDPTPSEAQGMLCGFVCSGGSDPLALWLTQVLPASDTDEAPPPAIVAELQPLAQAQQEALRDPELPFELRLPPDDAPLAHRATAVYDWVRGFLFALGVSAVTTQHPSAQIDEIIKDFMLLTQIDLEQIDDEEENELALAEIIEFIRVAAMLIYDECVPVNAPQS